MNEMHVGNTQRGVSLGVLRILERRASVNGESLLIDVPCGNGDFALFLKRNLRNLRVIGVDFFADAAGKGIEFFKCRAQEYFQKESPKNVDIITCVSGVMCFDGIEELFSLFHRSLKEQGLVVVTNDNYMTVRDRFSFLFFGRFKRFKLFYDVQEGNWNSISPQGIFMLLQRQEFKGLEIKYTSIYSEDYLWLPLALVIYPLFYLYIMMQKTSLSLSERQALFPFSSLLARHYIVSAKK
jgi:hypothetical protein